MNEASKLTKAIHASAMVLAAIQAAALYAADPGPPGKNLGDLSIEELMNTSITSVSKRETRLSDAAAAITVITSEDISHLNFTTVAEALRIAPGMDVARMSANEWAISARGFNNEYASKLLVLVDGRTVYTPNTAAVYWSDQDLVMEDLERVEVIRGPGATLWGANAVNGVVNIITKSARETQGLLVAADYGTEERPVSTLRYGGHFGADLYYRVYLKYFDRANYEDTSGEAAPDAWRSVHGGFRMDQERSSGDTLLTLQGDYHSDSTGQDWFNPSPAPPYSQQVRTPNANRGGNLLGRWTRNFSTTASSSLQLYYDYFRHTDTGSAENRNTFDLDWQHHFAFGGRQTVTWGVGYRNSRVNYPPTFYVSYSPSIEVDNLYTGFVQDEITLIRNCLVLTPGCKLEHNEQAGLTAQPSVRLLWKPAENQSVWTAVSRAVRYPAQFDTNARLNYVITPSDPPVWTVILGNKGAQPESVIAYEAGYRVTLTPQFSWDLTGFYDRYQHVISYDESAPFLEAQPAPFHLVVPLVTQNSVSGPTYGSELSVRWTPFTAWRLAAAYTWLRMETQPETFFVSPGDSPQNQFSLRSYCDLAPGIDFNSAVYYVDKLPNQGISSYLRLDLGLDWHPTGAWEIGVWVQNLLDHRHVEFSSFNTPNRAEVPRSVTGRMTWRY